MTSAKTILSAFIHFGNDDSAAGIPVSDAFWQALAEGKHPELDQGRLMSAYTFSEPWPMWERHPAGEELVMLLSGSATLVLDEPGGERAVQLSEPGDYVLVPRDVWHTARTSVPTTMLFLTPGAGTAHRPVDA